MKKNIRSFAVVVVFFIVFFFLLGKTNNEKNIKYVKIGGVNIKVELALTNSTQEQGLSGRQRLNDNEGMLFIFPKIGKYFFWMKDMNFPLDMIWIDENMKIVHIKKDARPELYPESYGPKEGAKYVLEVVSGFSDQRNLKNGDTIEFVK